VTASDRCPRAFDRRFPDLARSLPRIDIGAFPTPLFRAKRLKAAIGGLGELYVKNDGRSSALYGGNKVRKLEYVLAEAIRRGAREVMTFGFRGSNHAAATAVHAHHQGLRAISLLLPQADAPYVERNLEVGRAHNAEIHHYDTTAALSAGAVSLLVRHRIESSRWPYVIAPGGSSPLGTVGFVAAAFELAGQCRDLGIEPPEKIYVAFGSCGTAVGLALGAAAAQLHTRVVAVRVTEMRHANRRKAEALWRRTSALVHGADAAFPLLPYEADRIEIRDEHFGSAYAVPTAAAREAISSMREHEGIELDVAYTGKALACLIADARGKRLENRRVMFWNTYRQQETENPRGLS
jgi:1-aminocyclopropane-1-carboxylate deaminase/D-cysteine desulfhydrase-like pyridoxal-dependent ACC family enzyme